ncbi:MAG: hypothetical protein D6753_02060, partial [Planctomycetota bacterium]
MAVPLVIAALLGLGCRPVETPPAVSAERPVPAAPVAQSPTPDSAGTESPSPSTDASYADAVDASPRPMPADLWQTWIQQVIEGQSDRIQAEQHVSAEQMQELQAAGARLRELLLDGGVDMAGFSALASLPQLEHLRIRQTPVDDRFCRLVADALPRLLILNLPHGRITAAGIAELSRIESLVQLRLGGPQLDDRAAAAIAGLPALQSLHLIGPGLSPAGLRALASAPELSSLYIDDCPLPDE